MELIGVLIRVPFDLFNEPTAHVVSVHICNLENTSSVSVYSKKMILTNMYNAYGVRTVNGVIRDFFPEFYKKEIAA
jgi:hypothetical protein